MIEDFDSPPDAESTIDAPISTDPVLQRHTSSGRFQILRPHAKGGLGQVFLARDLELNREVAVKEIQDRYAQDQNAQKRFILEAEVTGRLEHPGIVAVYGLGKHADGRPYYATRFLRGKSLNTAIAEFHRVDLSVRQRIVELRRLLARFITVCNTIAYVHSRSVLHRDIKPANIMLGPFGETLVVDWGLAKVAGESDTASETLQLALSGSAELTQPGVPVGTPAYMSPEQAAGRRDLTGPASDIYSLGATLYCLLTGVAPFSGNNIAEVLQRVQQGKPMSPNHVNYWVPPALSAICEKAMARLPDERYTSAEALAQDVENWLADEPVNAYGAPLFLRVARWFRQHTLLVTTIGVFLAMMLLLWPLILMIVALAMTGGAE